MEVYQKHRTALFNAFSKGCNQFDRALWDELVKNDDSSAKEKEELCEEVRSLREQLKKAREDQQETDRLGPVFEPDAIDARLPTPKSSAAIEAEGIPQSTDQVKVSPIDPGHTEDLVSREIHDELVAKFNDLTRQYNLLQDAHQTLLNKYRKEKGTIKSWAKYMEKHRLRKRRDPTERAMSISPAVGPADTASEQEDTIPPIRQIGLFSGLGRQNSNGYPGNSSSKPQRSFHRKEDTATTDRASFPVSLDHDVKRTQAPTQIPKGLSCFETIFGFADKGGADQRIKSQEVKPSIAIMSGNLNHLASSTVVPSNPDRRSRSKFQRPANMTAKGDASETTDEEEEYRAGSFSAAKATDFAVEAGDTLTRQAVLEGLTSSPEPPVVVSECALKRKGAPPLGSADKPIRVKSEHGSSSPLGLSRFRDYAEMQENLDLDEVGDRIDTPRKKRRFEDDSGNDQDLWLARSELDLEDTIGDSQVVMGTHFMDAHNDQVASERNKSNYQAQMSVATNLHAPVLQPSSPNLGLLPRTAHPKSMAYISKSDKRLQRAAANVPSLAEDGEDLLESNLKEDHHSRAKPHNRNDEGEEDVKKFKHQRLNALLEGRSPGQQVLSPSPQRGKCFADPQTGSKTFDRDGSMKGFLKQEDKCSEVTRTQRNLFNQRGADITSRQEIKVNSLVQGVTTLRDENREGSHDNRRANTGSRRKQRSEPPNIATSREKGRLRDKPLHRLTLEDFKVNPNYSAGYDYAYTETVRNRDERKCLPGCTRADCCGRTFRKALELGGIPLSVKKALVWNSSQEQEDEEQRLLEDYMGEDSSRLKKLSREERDELVIQAHTKQFADKHGRHRQAFERRTTPPGFWRTDMPTTQEWEADREQARRMERDIVEERYREAMRAKGKWTFRDE